MDPCDPCHLFNDDNNDDDNDDDDIFVNMMYRYSTYVLLQPDPSPLLRRCAMLNRDCEEWHRRIVNDYFAVNCVYQPSDFKRRVLLRKKTCLNR